VMLCFVAVPSANKSHVVPRYCCLLSLLRSITAVGASSPIGTAAAVETAVPNAKASSGAASSERAAATAVTVGAAAAMGSADPAEKDARISEAIQEGRRRCLLTKYTHLQKL
jgi:hypothetical protein